jgi:hypothetical protein
MRAALMARTLSTVELIRARRGSSAASATRQPGRARRGPHVKEPPLPQGSFAQPFSDWAFFARLVDAAGAARQGRSPWI